MMIPLVYAYVCVSMFVCMHTLYVHMCICACMYVCVYPCVLYNKNFGGLVSKHWRIEYLAEGNQGKAKKLADKTLNEPPILPRFFTTNSIHYQ